MPIKNPKALAAATRDYAAELQTFAAQLEANMPLEQLRARAKVLVEITRTWEALVEVSVIQKPTVQ